MRKIMHLGLDDTDSTRNGCTTYLASLLVSKLAQLNVEFIDYPNLIRLNPNVPWKTRGNGALCLRFEYEEEQEAEIIAVTIDLIETNADIAVAGTDPGIVFFAKRKIPNDFKNFSKKTETDIVTLKQATSVISKHGAEALGYNTCRGIIGALAAIGETLDGDHTFELIAYRTPENRGSKRRVDLESVFEMDRQTKPLTFNNVDAEKRRVIITPRGPDPLLFGIRGESAEIVKHAFGLVKTLEPIERWLIFRSNQGTDAHLTKANALNQLRPHRSVIASGIVSRRPCVVPKRHVIFAVKDSTTEVDCAAYEPSGDLRKLASQLVIGDEIEVYGAVREASVRIPLTVNLEKINIKTLAPNIAYKNPPCPTCGKNMMSMGRGQGFKCKKCGAKFKTAKKILFEQVRHVGPGLYFASSRSQRHLTKPLRRYGQERDGYNVRKLMSEWHS